MVITYTAYFYLSPPIFRIVEESEEEKVESNITLKINCAYNETFGNENFLRYDCKETLLVENIEEELIRMEILEIIEFDGRVINGTPTIILDVLKQMKDFFLKYQVQL